MKQQRWYLALAALLALAFVALPAAAWIRSPATTFATLPPGATPPEGIATDGNGNVYVSTFGYPASGESHAPGQVIVFDSHGKLLRQLIVTGATPHLLGLAFHPMTGQLLVLDFGAGQVLNVNPQTGAASVFSDIGPMSGINALTFDELGNVYISDSFQGIIWQTGPNGGLATAWVADPLLTTTGKPPFGANGLAFNNDGTALFVANTGDDSVIEIPVTNGKPGTPAPFAYSINGADGLAIDANDNVWVVANQSDEIVVLDPTGKVIAKLGDFDGIDNKGAVRGLLFPASLVFNGSFLLVTNLVLDTRLFGFPTLDSQWAAQVTSYTVSKINSHLPPGQGGEGGKGGGGNGGGKGGGHD
jgi:sugar lactone lactonase YvrE